MTWPEMRNVDLETFLSLDKETRTLMLRLLGSEGETADADWAALDAHPQGQALASWLLTLPAYNAVPEDADE